MLLAPSIMAISTRLLLLLGFLCCLSQTAWAVREAARNIYEIGHLSVKTFKVPRKGELPRSLWVAIPEDAGEYPVVQFQHGFKLQNTDYSRLLEQVASWGFIVVAPQMHNLVPSGLATEITTARTILSWMKTGLVAVLKRDFPYHQPDLDKVALAGHSRGGYVVFGLALSYGNDSDALRPYSAIVGLDPVDATTDSVLTGKEDSVDVGVPTLIVGAGLGPKQMWGWLPACAPKDLGHVDFYKDLAPPSFHFVATNNGHLDFTNDCRWWETFCAVRCLPACEAGPSRQLMHQFSAGIMVAFLQDALFHNNASLSAALAQEDYPPVLLDPPQCKANRPACTNEAHLYADTRLLMARAH